MVFEEILPFCIVVLKNFGLLEDLCKLLVSVCEGCATKTVGGVGMRKITPTLGGACMRH